MDQCPVFWKDQSGTICFSFHAQRANLLWSRKACLVPWCRGCPAQSLESPMKRITLFLATNLAIVLVLSLSARLLGLEPYLSAQGLDLGALLAFAALMGFGGSFLSLALSKFFSQRSTALSKA